MSRLRSTIHCGQKRVALVHRPAEPARHLPSQAAQYQFLPAISFAAPAIERFFHCAPRRICRHERRSQPSIKGSLAESQAETFQNLRKNLPEPPFSRFYPYDVNAAHVEHRLGARDGPVHARNSGSSTEHLELRQLRGQRLLSVSPATIDRLLTAIRRKASHRKPPRRSCAPNVAPWIHWSFCTAFGSLCISASDRGLLCERGNRPFHHSISTSEGGASLVV